MNLRGMTVANMLGMSFYERVIGLKYGWRNGVEWSIGSKKSLVGIEDW